jgi:type VI secretion system protein ImpK
MTEAVWQDPGLADSGKLTLKDLIKDFVSMALIIRRGREVASVDDFIAKVDNFLDDLERKGRAANFSVEQVSDTQYALCAFLDESVLRAYGTSLRSAFEIKPMQFRRFGVHLAGEGFFDKVNALRADVQANLDVLEVYHLCLALGFEGKYSLGQTDELRYLANNLGRDIARYRTAPAALSADWALPDPVAQMVRDEVPVWMYLALIALLCVAVYGVLDWLLDQQVTALAAQISQLFSA